MTYHYELTEYNIIDEETDAYTFNPEARFHWLQRLCIRILSKLGCHYTYTGGFKYWKLIRDPIQFMDMIESQLTQLSKMGKEPKYIIVGLDCIPVLNYHRGHRDYISDINTESISIKANEWRGLKVSIHPHLTGAYILPEINFE